MTPRGKRHACRPLARETWTCAARGLILCLLVFSLPVASGQQVSLPPVNLGDTNFLDGVAGPGLLVEETFEYYHGYRLTGPRGHKLPGDNSLGSLLSSTHVAYLTELKILGGYYGVEAVVPVAFLDVDTDLGLRGSRVGVGDLSLSPFMLQWTDQTLFGMSYLHRLDLVVILPTGRYSRDSTVNVGSNVFSLNPYYAFTLFLTPRLETSWRVHYLWTSENTDPNPVFQAGSVQPGQVMHFNAALSYEVWPRSAGRPRRVLPQADHRCEDRRPLGSGLEGAGRGDRARPARVRERALPIPQRLLRGRRGESPSRDEARVASVEGILMADPRALTCGEVRWAAGWERCPIIPVETIGFQL
jgi:hypothetical protein